jgi:two-component system sensor histidine kinase/response regulator
MAFSAARGDSADLMDAVDFPPIAGLDTADGLRRAAGDPRLYTELLRLFVDGHRNAAGEIEISLGRGDEAVAERVAHSVKGVAGNIGAMRVRAAAGQVETAIRAHSGRDHIERLRQSLASELAAIVASLEPVLTSEIDDGDEPPLAPADPITLQVSIERLTTLLEQFDPAAVACVESERHVLRTIFTREQFAAFERLVNGYSFDDAIACLSAAAIPQSR